MLENQRLLLNPKRIVQNQGQSTLLCKAVKFGAIAGFKVPRCSSRSWREHYKDFNVSPSCLPRGTHRTVAPPKHNFPPFFFPRLRPRPIKICISPISQELYPRVIVIFTRCASNTLCLVPFIPKETRFSPHSSTTVKSIHCTKACFLISLEIHQTRKDHITQNLKRLLSAPSYARVLLEINPRETI